MKKLQLVICISLIYEAVGILMSKFYPFGLRYGDSRMANGDDTIFPAIKISTEFQYFNRRHRSLFVNINGDISFGKGVTSYSLNKFPIQQNSMVIAVYLVDIDTTKGGDIWYRETTDPSILQRISTDIQLIYSWPRNFHAKWCFIATWSDVSAHSGKSKRLTFQCVLVTDGIYSFVIELYNKIEVPNGVVAFDAGDGLRKYSIPGSKSLIMKNITQLSNIGVPGKFIYRVESFTIENNDCARQKCNNNGTCVDSPRFMTWKCVCSPNYTGTYCDSVIDECKHKFCFHGGTCVDLIGINTWECKCIPGFTGSHCETKIDECKNQICYHGGTCVDLIGFRTWKCNCIPGFIGNNCETEIDECKNQTCYHGGTCVDLFGFGNWKCNCFPGFTGNNCEIDIDECENVTCLHGNCVDEVNDYYCECFLFYSGYKCLQYNILHIVFTTVTTLALLCLGLFCAWCWCNSTFGNKTESKKVTHVTITPKPAIEENPNRWLY